MSDEEAISVRRLSEGDVEAVCRILVRAGICQSLGLTGRVASLCDSAGSLCLVAARGEKVVGVVLATYNGFHVFLSHIAVAQDDQHQGIGRRLHEELTTNAWRLGAKGVIADSRLAATGFFYNLGYRTPGSVFLIHPMP
jgi:predicted N-acetyltransferase YhbS